MFTKIKQAWRVLRGKVYVANPPKVIYVRDSNPDRFVQLLTYRDYILGLDGDGRIYRLSEHFGNGFVVEFLMDSPRGY